MVTNSETCYSVIFVYLTVVIYCLFMYHLQINKPLMERRRRARINQSLTQLKTLVLSSMNKDVSILLYILVRIKLSTLPTRVDLAHVQSYWWYVIRWKQVVVIYITVLGIRNEISNRWHGSAWIPLVDCLWVIISNGCLINKMEVSDYLWKLHVHFYFRYNLLLHVLLREKSKWSLHRWQTLR